MGETFNFTSHFHFVVEEELWSLNYLIVVIIVAVIVNICTVLYADCCTHIISSNLQVLPRWYYSYC